MTDQPAPATGETDRARDDRVRSIVVGWVRSSNPVSELLDALAPFLRATPTGESAGWREALGGLIEEHEFICKHAGRKPQQPWHAAKAMLAAAPSPRAGEGVGERLVTITIGIGRNGDIYEDTQTHGNSYADVYRGIHAVKAEVERLIGERRECPNNPGHESKWIRRSTYGRYAGKGAGRPQQTDPRSKP
jgi:hypothetical protein